MVDDDKGHCDACVRILKQERLNVYAAKDGREALQILTKNQDIRIVLTDILMPEKEGLELIMDLRRGRKDIEIIAMSGGGIVRADDCLSFSRRLGVTQTLSKPFSRAELLHAIQSIAEGQSS